MGRAACMGHDVFALLNSRWPLFNLQKGRVDYLLDVLADPRLRARPSKVAPFLERQDVLPFIAQEANLAWLKFPPPLALYMDSYSELTDQLFIHHQDKWRFCCNYSDLYHTPQFEIQFKTEGLIPLESLLMKYRCFFGMVRQRWPNVPIVFLHFPVKLDEREKFKLRYECILDSITQIKQEFQPFYSLTVDASVVDWPEVKIPNLEDFPYHYNLCTYLAFAKKIRNTGIFDSVSKPR